MIFHILLIKRFCVNKLFEKNLWRKNFWMKSVHVEWLVLNYYKKQFPAWEDLSWKNWHVIEVNMVNESVQTVLIYLYQIIQYEIQAVTMRLYAI